MNGEFHPLNIALAAERVRTLLKEIDATLQAIQVLLARGEPVHPREIEMARRLTNDLRYKVQIVSRTLSSSVETPPTERGP